jgi:protocatechuate 3,4-dioxygenase beta subunit
MTPRKRSVAIACTAAAMAAPSFAAAAESSAREAATCAASPAQTEGPYYTPDPPRRTSLVGNGVTGTRLLLSGRVLDRQCRPITNARVDFWQADGNGVYDNTGYRLRGFQRTDAKGRYRLVTVVPGQYPGRTEHIHVKVTPPGGSMLTTQLYFPNSDSNDSDGIFSSALVVRLTTSTKPWRATFTFVVRR